MNSKWPNVLCASGVGLIGWALFAVHPALCAGFCGSLLVFLGVYSHRKKEGAK